MYTIKYLDIHNKLSNSKYFKLHLNPFLPSIIQRLEILSPLTQGSANYVSWTKSGLLSIAQPTS